MPREVIIMIIAYQPHKRIYLLNYSLFSSRLDHLVLVSCCRCQELVYSTSQPKTKRKVQDRETIALIRPPQIFPDFDRVMPNYSTVWRRPNARVQARVRESPTLVCTAAPPRDTCPASHTIQPSYSEWLQPEVRAQKRIEERFSASVLLDDFRLTSIP